METADSAGPAEQLGDLLLSLAGRVDDDAVNTTREMLGTGHAGPAAEFLVGCLLAGRIPVSADERGQLDAVLDELRCPRDFVERLHVVDRIPDEEHRFSEQPSSGEELADALAPVAARLTGVRGLWCAWRTTPAGVTYGAVPQRVLLAEVGSDGSAVAAGYQLVQALRRAEIDCAVDVFTTGADLPVYHRDALGSARRVHLDLPAGAATGHASPNHGRAPRMTSSGEPAGVSELSDPPLTPPPDPRSAPRVPGLSEARAVAELQDDWDEEPVGQRFAAAESAADREEFAEAQLVGAEPGLADVTPEVADAAATDGPATDAAGDAAALDAAAADVAAAEVAEFAAPAEPEPAESVEQLDEQTFEQAAEEFGSVPSEEDSAVEEPVAGGPAAGGPVAGESAADDAEVSDDSAEETAEESADDGSGDGESNMRVPAAVDAKLTDRERNLLRKLHEELAQREHDRDGSQRVTNQSWSEVPGGGFPSIGAGNGRQHRRQ